MDRDEFLLTLRVAAGALSPVAHVNGIRLSPEHMTNVLRRGNLWLTTKTVEDFDADSFRNTLTDDQIKELEHHIKAFREAAEKVPPNEDPTPAQKETALPHFITILTTMLPYMEGFRVYPAAKAAGLPDVVDFAVRVGEDWSGDAAVWVWCIVADDLPDEELFPNMRGIDFKLEKAFRKWKIKGIPYVSYRSKSEQLELEKEPATRRTSRR